MTDITEGKHPGEFIASEASGHRSRETVTLLTGEKAAAGEVLGRVTKGAATADGTGNTGDGAVEDIALGPAAKVGNYVLTCVGVSAGAVTLTVPETGVAAPGNTEGSGTMTGVGDGGGVKEGIYTMLCIDATVSGAEVFAVYDPDGHRLADATVGVAYSGPQIDFAITGTETEFVAGDGFTVTVASATADHDSGTFSVFDPEGYRLPDAAVGVAYETGQIGFTISDGDTDFVIGDEFTVTVAEGSGGYAAYDPDAVDGSQIAAAVSYGNYDATGGDMKAVAIVRDAEVNGNEIVWPADITDGEKAAAIEQLAVRYILVRD